MEAVYIECLNACFDGWGGPGMYRWCFARTVGSHPADLMVLEEDGHPIAGSAINYRHVSLANNAAILVAVMTGSWTLPAARQKGCFKRIIQESLALAEERGAALLLAFVTESNPSSRGLEAAGSAMFPTHYLFSRSDSPAPQSEASTVIVEDTQPTAEIIEDRLSVDRAGHSRVAYTAAQWRSQFLERPYHTELLSIEREGLAVVETKGNSDHVQFISPRGAASFDVCLGALHGRAATRGRQLVLFTTSARWAESCVRAGFERVQGYLTALVADAGILAPAIPGAKGVTLDRSRPLSDSEDPGYLGPWDIQSGDRM